jgi:hypothetical protein
MMERSVALCGDGLRREVARQGWMLRFLSVVCVWGGDAMLVSLSLSSDFCVSPD